VQSPFHRCDKTPQINNLKEERLIFGLMVSDGLVHGQVAPLFWEEAAVRTARRETERERERERKGGRGRNQGPNTPFKSTPQVTHFLYAPHLPKFPSLPQSTNLSAHETSGDISDWNHDHPASCFLPYVSPIQVSRWWHLSGPL
jgi:hypothetical protein